MNPIQQRSDLSISCIFSAVQKPHSSTAQKCKAQIKAASVKEIDYTLRKINQYKKKRQDDWPKSRLLRCIDYLMEHMTKLGHVVQLPSFIQCISWTLDNVNTTESPQTNQMAIKIIAKTLERARSLETTNQKRYLLHIVSEKMNPDNWLFHHQQLPAVRIYALRALVTHIDYFAPKLSAYIPKCLHQLTLIPSLLQTLSLRPKVTDYGEKKQQLEHLVMYARLLEGFVVEQVDPLLAIWTAVARAYYEQSIGYRNQEILLYSLTSALHRSMSTHFTFTKVQTTTLLCLMDTLMRHWARDICCSMHPPVYSPRILEIETNILKKCLRISLKLLSPLPDEVFYKDYHCHLVLSTLNFILCYVGQPVSPEEALTIGSDTCISSDMCIDVDERGYQVTPLPQHQDLLNLLLEVLMQNVQRTPTDITQPMAGRVAWCIKSFFTILLDHQDTFQSLVHRLEKMTIFFLHFDSAIDMLATSSTNISQHLWKPTIEQAKQGLILASSPEMVCDPGLLDKSKRAFMSLEKISYHARACERLVDCDVLQLVNADWIPSGEVIQRSKTLLVVYALFGRFMASLLHRTAFVRTRLRDELDLFSIIIKLLKESVTHRQYLRSHWNYVILGCLSVARTFQYDESSMKIWLQHNELLPLMLRIVLDDTMVWTLDKSVILSTLSLLEQFAIQPLCGVQVITEEGTLMKLALLLEKLIEMDDNNKDGDDVIMLDNPPMDRPDKQDDDEEAEFNDVSEGEENKDDNDDQEEQQLANELEPILDFEHIIDMTPPDDEEGIQQQHLEEYNFPKKDGIHIDSAEYLRKSLVKMLTCHDNIQLIILSDAFTQVFRPLTSLQWRHAISTDLYEKKMVDLQTLYHFTDNTDNAVKLHELTAVAIGYAAIGAPTPNDWNHSLGLKQDISVSVFGMLCLMLIDETSATKREVAAQVIVALGFACKKNWDFSDGLTISSFGSFLFDSDDTTSENQQENDSVRFKADDSDRTVTANRNLIRKRSPIFESMLGATFVESTLEVIPIHDVTFDHLALFLRVLQEQQRNNNNNDIADIISLDQDWHSVICLLQLADRFDAPHVKMICEYWIMYQIYHRPTKRTWQGLISFYRRCRDPHPSEKTTNWPFAAIVNAGLKAILLHLTDVCDTIEFLELIRDEEVGMFCESLGFLLIK